MEVTNTKTRDLESWKANLKKSENKLSFSSDVLFSKVIPDHHSYCRIHNIPMKEKNVWIKHYGIMGYYCPECNDFYIEDHKIEGITRNLQKRNVFYAIKSEGNWNFSEDTIRNMNGNVIYVSDLWKKEQKYCPLHEQTKLSYNIYQKMIDGNQITFEACFCPSCNKILMGRDHAEKLEKNFIQKNITKIHFKSLKNDSSKKILPHYVLSNGKINKYDLAKISQNNWNEVDEEDTLVVSENGRCKHHNHTIRKMQGILKVRERSLLHRNYLVPLSYCEECGEYHINLEDYSMIFTAGRPLAKIVELANKNGNITSGAGFDHEEKHLNDLENAFNTKISDIKSEPYYVDEYETISGAGNDDEVSRLIGEKDRCRPLYKEIKKIQSYQDIPYTNRVDIVRDGNTKVYYLGINDIIMDGKTKVISTRSDYGRSLVNYRNKKIKKNDKWCDVKRRREFVLEKAHLYGYTEQVDTDIMFQKGITDPFLINVLNMRKNRHQLLDIISTIQENQNLIIDEPMENNLIVQGCAGSGKTMVMLHRLSIMQYNNPKFNFYHTAILTPNTHFNTHIAGLVSSLQIKHTRRYTVENYYTALIEKYDFSMKVRDVIADEQDVDQMYVDYIYSDDFKFIFRHEFKKKMDEINSMEESERSKLKVKSIYNSIYKAATKKADELLKEKTGKSYLKNIKGTYRYDLYLQLLFCRWYFGKAVGEDTLLCIDEGQDLAVNEYALIKSVNKEGVIFNIYGDTNQLLKTGRGINDWSQLEILFKNTSKFELKENYRNTNQITQYCNNLFDMNITRTGVDGPHVERINRSDLETSLSNINITNERLALLLPRSIDKDSEFLSSDSLTENLHNVLSDQIDNGKIAVMYVDEVKGVEFDQIYVITDGMEKNEKYIALTRALSKLTVVENNV